MRHRMRRMEHLLQLHEIALDHAVGNSEGIKSGNHLEEGLEVRCNSWYKDFPSTQRVAAKGRTLFRRWSPPCKHTGLLSGVWCTLAVNWVPVTDHRTLGFDIPSLRPPEFDHPDSFLEF